MNPNRCPYSDLFDPEFIADPYPALAIARRENPVVHLPELNLWLVSTFSHVQQVLRDPEKFTNANVQQPLFPFAAETKQYLVQSGFSPGPALTGSDGDLHARLRKNLQSALEFTPDKLQELESMIEASACQLIDAVSPMSEFDLVQSLTFKFPARVVFRLIGFPEEHDDQLQGWCLDRLRMFWGYSSVQEQLPIAEGLSEYWRYCVDFVEHYRGPNTSITRRLLDTHREDPEQLSKHEIAGIIFGLVFAGQETTANLLASMFMFLLSDRSRWDRVREDRNLSDRAFNETLRLAPPIAAWRRLTNEDVVLGGVQIPKGSHLLVHLGSAGHDEEKFVNAEKFDLDRREAAKHLAFGVGRHFCLGASLARLEARVVLNLVLDRMSDIELVSEQEINYVPNIAFRGPDRVLVRRLQSN